MEFVDFAIMFTSFLLGGWSNEFKNDKDANRPIFFSRSMIIFMTVILCLSIAIKVFSIN